MISSDVVTWIGTGVSMVGAAVAIWQAFEAKSAAKKVVELRDDIIGKHEHGILSDLDGKLTAAHKTMDKYGPGASASRRMGSVIIADATSVRAFVAEFQRHNEMLQSTLGLPVLELPSTLNSLLDQFGASQTDVDRLKFGAQIYQELSLFRGSMKQAIDTKVFGSTKTVPRT
jgi:hypothetical protein